jgi:hypothetical protein
MAASAPLCGFRTAAQIATESSNPGQLVLSTGRAANQHCGPGVRIISKLLYSPKRTVLPQFDARSREQLFDLHRCSHRSRPVLVASTLPIWSMVRGWQTPDAGRAAAGLSLIVLSFLQPGSDNSEQPVTLGVSI